MNSQQPSPRPRLLPAIAASLSNLRTKIRRYIWLEGIFTLVVVLFTLCWISFAVDRLLELSVLSRVAMFLMGLGIFGYFCYRRFLSRLLRKISDEDCAVLLERRFANLNDVLLSTLMFDSLDARREMESKRAERREEVGLDAEQPTFDYLANQDAELLMATRQQAEAAARKLDVQQVLNYRPLVKVTAWASVLTLSVILFAIILPSAASVWFQRAVLFSDVAWPHDIVMTIEGFQDDGVAHVGEGNNFVITALVDVRKSNLEEGLPESGLVYLTNRRGKETVHTMRKVGDAIAEMEFAPEDQPLYQRYEYALQTVMSRHEVEVYVGDAYSGVLELAVLKNPAIASYHFDVKFPKYTGLLPEKFAQRSVVRVPLGTEATFVAKPSKTLRQVRWTRVVSSKTFPTETITIEQPKGKAGEPQAFKIPLGKILTETTLQIELLDTDNIDSPEAFTVKLQCLDDLIPKFEDFELVGIGESITPNAILPFTGKVTDDYGVDKLWVEADIQNIQGAWLTKRHAILLGEFSRDAEQSKNQIRTEIAMDNFALDLMEPYVNEPDVKKKRDLDLLPNQRLSLLLRARDQFNVKDGNPETPDGPQVGITEKFVLEVVTPKRMRGILESDEVIQRQELEKIITLLEEQMTWLVNLEFSEDAEEPQKLTDQIAIVENASDECGEAQMRVLRVVEKLRFIRAQISNNRLNDLEWEDHLEQKLAEPLEVLGQTAFASLNTTLTELLKNIEAKVIADKMRSEANSKLAEIVEQLKVIVSTMQQRENIDEAIKMARQIMETEKVLREMLEEIRKEDLKELGGLRDLIDDEPEEPSVPEPEATSEGT